MIRPATVADIPALARLVEQYWKFEQIAGVSRVDVEGRLAELVATPDLGATWVALHELLDKPLPIGS